jgi:hypothetical protein
MLEFLIDSIFVEFGNCNFNKSSAFPWEHTASLRSFLYSDLIKDKRTIEVKAFNLKFRDIYDVLSSNNPSFANWIPLKNLR